MVQQYIAEHVGICEGFIQGTKLIFMAELESNGYYKEMSADNIYRWVSERLIPNRLAKRVVNTSNAAYHNVQTDNFYAKKVHGILSLVANA